MPTDAVVISRQGHRPCSSASCSCLVHPQKVLSSRASQPLASDYPRIRLPGYRAFCFSHRGSCGLDLRSPRRCRGWPGGVWCIRGWRSSPPISWRAGGERETRQCRWPPEPLTAARFRRWQSRSQRIHLRRQDSSRSASCSGDCASRRCRQTWHAVEGDIDDDVTTTVRCSAKYQEG